MDRLRTAPALSSPPPGAADAWLRRSEMALPRTPSRLRLGAGTLIHAFKNFKRSSAPARILFFRDGEWTDFDPAVFGALRGEFVAGKTAFELRIGECAYVFDFLAMTQVEAETGASNSVAWIDVQGRCFFPASAVDDRGSLLRVDKSDSSPAASSECDSTECHRERISGDSCEASAVASLEQQPRWPGTEALGDDDRYYKVVSRLFLSGLRGLVPNAAVTAVHKCSLSGQGRASRLKAFQLHAQMTKASRGDAKVKFGWYAASATEVAAVVAHGLGRPNNERLGPNACGVGVHLSAPHCTYSSALLPGAAAAAAEEERHMVLCRVIMGRPERVEAGSARCLPSSEEFDSGVDDLMNPKWYVVWSTHMNTHILPEYVVSYKLSRQPEIAPPKMASSERTPVLMNLLLPRLLAEMGGSLPSVARALQNIYKQYKAKRIGKEAFIRYVRSTVGDKVLVSTIKKMRGY